uniref:Uncharacterized protein n=1 Tax=Amphimedon queenslandica TaxID=400682 RepID=A0A1X7VKE6_AMPQE
MAEDSSTHVSDDPHLPPKKPRGRPHKHLKNGDLLLSDQLDAFFVEVKSKLEASTKQILADALAPLRSLLQKQVDTINKCLSSLEPECRAEIEKLASSVTKIQEELSSHSSAVATVSPPQVVHISGHTVSASAGGGRYAPHLGSISSATIDCKFNIIAFGISECSHGSPRHERSNQDLLKISDLFKTIDSSFNSMSVSDLRRLGKYSPEARSPRPLLVSFLRTSDVQHILGHSHEVSSTYRVQSNHSHEERADRALLLQERYQLISSGTVDRSSVKIKHLSMFVNDRLHCKVVNSQLVRSHTLGDLSTSLTELGDTSVSHSHED